MKEGHLRSKTLESIVQTSDITAKFETQNFGNEKIYFGTSRSMKLSLYLPFFHRVYTSRNKNYEVNFFGDENQYIFNFNSSSLGQLETK